MGFASAKPMEATRRVLEERKAAGLAGGMQFTYRNPTRSTDPGRVLPGAAALVVGAWAYGGRDAPPGDELPPGEEPAPHLDGRPKGIVARYARRDHYGDLRTALGTLADVLKARGWAARVLVDDNALVDRAAAQAAGLGWFAQKLQHAAATAWLLVRLGIGRNRCPAPVECPCSRRLWGVPPLPRVVPDRRAGGARCARRPSVPGVAPPGAGHLPFRLQGGARGQDLRLRRLPGSVPGQQPARWAEDRPGGPRQRAGAGRGARWGAGRGARPERAGAKRPAGETPAKAGPGPGSGAR